MANKSLFTAELLFKDFTIWNKRERNERKELNIKEIN